METYLVANAISAAVVIVGLLVFKNLKKQVPCDSCKYLYKKGGGGAWKYYCCKNGEWYINLDSFDTPPEYCKAWEFRGEQE